MKALNWRTHAAGATSARKHQTRLRRLFPHSENWWTGRRRRRVVASILIAAAIIAGVALRFNRTAPPEPGILRRAAHVALIDTSGRPHTSAEWRGSPAVVLYFLDMESLSSSVDSSAVRQLFKTYGPRGVVFLGVQPDPDVSAEVVAKHARERGIEFPILLDPKQDLTDQVGVSVTPEVAVLDREGNVRYRGRMDDVDGIERNGGKIIESATLQAALDAVLSGREPAVTETEADGRPIPRARVAAPGEQVVYTKHVAPILQNRCAGCHRPGEVGPFSLLTYRDAAKRAGFIRDITAERRMPPWKPKDGFGEFLDDAHLTRRELATLAAWADAGAPEGNPADLPPTPQFPQGWQLGTPDLVLEMPESFAVPAREDVYRAFVLPIPQGTDFQGLAAVEFRPGNRRIVHHARFYVDATPDCRRRDEASEGLGFPSVGGADIPKPTLGAWVPGSNTRMPPHGTGFVLQRGSDLALLIHYHGTGKVEHDRSSIGFYFSKSPITQSMYAIPLSSQKIDIPAGESRYRIDLHATLPADVHAYSVLPHGHFLMREIKAWATLPNGTTRRLLWIDDWDFNWQGQFHFAEPIPLPKGTVLRVIAHYDNSAGNPSNPNSPPIRVRYGVTSRDEMLGCFIRVLPNGPDDKQAIQKKKWGPTL